LATRRLLLWRERHRQRCGTLVPNQLTCSRDTPNPATLMTRRLSSQVVPKPEFNLDRKSRSSILKNCISHCNS
jgi:hypothetical protein